MCFFSSNRPRPSFVVLRYRGVESGCFVESWTYGACSRSDGAGAVPVGMLAVVSALDVSQRVDEGWPNLAGDDRMTRMGS